MVLVFCCWLVGAGLLRLAFWFLFVFCDYVWCFLVCFFLVFLVGSSCWVVFFCVFGVFLFCWKKKQAKTSRRQINNAPEGTKCKNDPTKTRARAREREWGQRKLPSPFVCCFRCGFGFGACFFGADSVCFCLNSWRIAGARERLGFRV